MSNKFERCAGCWVVAKGEVCNILPLLVQEVDLDRQDFIKVEATCPQIGKGHKVFIKKEGAKLGEWGNIMSEIGLGF